MAKGYSPRKSNNKREYKILVIVCEGQKTERTYFNHYRERKSGLRIITPNSTRTDPESLVKFALAQIRKYDLDLDNGDQIWCVFDADRNTNKNIEKADACGKDKVRLCLSNPCFELWYLLHFCYFENRITIESLQDKLKQYIKDYDKTRDYFDVLIEKRKTAIGNAKKLNEKHAPKMKLLSMQSNPSTQVFQLVEHILKMRKGIVQQIA